MTADIRGILNGAVPAPTKKEQQLAAKRQRDRKRYSLQTNQPWKTNVDQKPLSASASMKRNATPEQLQQFALWALKTTP